MAFQLPPLSRRQRCQADAAHTLAAQVLQGALFVQPAAQFQSIDVFAREGILEVFTSKFVTDKGVLIAAWDPNSTPIIANGDGKIRLVDMISGVTFTPDGRNLFISVQHPGETPTDRSDPKQPQKYSSWPDYQAYGRPRSANVVIRKIDGGVIGT